MSWYRWLACTLLLVVVDGALLYLLLGLLAFVARLARAPLSLAACVALLAAAVLFVAARQALARHRPGATWPGVVAGAAAVWLAVAGVGPVAGSHAGLAWPATLLAGPGGGLRVALVLSLLSGAWLWRHGMRRALGTSAAPVIARSFRGGLVLFIVVLALEAASGMEFGTGVALVPFFVASLLGMALARAPRGGAATRAWLSVVGGSVAVVLAAGLALAALAVVVVRGGALALGAVWQRLAAEVTASVSQTLAELFGAAREPGFDLRGAPVEIPESVVLAVLLAGGVVTAWAAGRLFSAPRQALPKLVIDLGEEQREAIAEHDTPPVERLFQAILPAWLRRSRRTAAGPPAHADPGVAAAHALYRRLLELARRRGVALQPAHTPYERARGLRRDLPGVPVDAITGHFVAARYGGRAPPDAVLAALGRALEEAGAER